MVMEEFDDEDGEVRSRLLLQVAGSATAPMIRCAQFRMQDEEAADDTSRCHRMGHVLVPFQAT
jgi:hypothetical protein